MNVMKDKNWKRMWRGFLLAVVIASALSTVSCGGSVYVGVGVAGPYYGYPYGPGWPVGGVVVGRPLPY
jgi:hypothetical protein